VTSDGFAERCVATATGEFGGLDIIVNNAGYAWGSSIGKITDEMWDAMIDVHLTAPFRILRAAQPVIAKAANSEREEGTLVHRKVVNVSSIVGLYGGLGQLNYAAAKAGITGMTRTLAKEWGRYNVNVNAVAVGGIDTRLTSVEPDGTSASTSTVAGSSSALRSRRSTGSRRWCRSVASALRTSGGFGCHADLPGVGLRERADPGHGRRLRRLMSTP